MFDFSKGCSLEKNKLAKSFLTTNALKSTLPLLMVAIAPVAYGQTASNTADVAVPSSYTDPVAGNNSATDTDSIIPATTGGALPPNPSAKCTINWHRWRTARQLGRTVANAVNPTTHSFGKIDTALGPQTWYTPTQTFNAGIDSFDNIRNDNYGLSVFDQTVENPTSARATRTGEGFYGIAKFELEPNVKATIPLEDPGMVDGHSFIAYNSAGTPLARFPSADSVAINGKFYIAANSQAGAGFVDADGIDEESGWTSDAFEVDVPADGIVYVHYVLADEGKAHRHALRYCPQDVGDAPVSYGIAAHTYETDLLIGTKKDIDINLAGNGTASSDDNDGDGDNDEDGITLPTFTQGQTATITADVMGAGGYLQAWIDFDGNGTFEANEQVAADLQDGGTDDTSSAVGEISFTVPVPSDAVTTQTFARFRWSTTSGLDVTTAAADGEVEDYAVTVAVAASDVDLVTIKTLSSGDDTPNEGDTVAFSIAVRNDGPGNATNVSLTDLLPDGLTATPNNGTTDDGSGNAVGTYDATSGLWSIGALTNGATVTLTLEGKVDTGESGNTITNTTTAAAGDEPDPDDSTNDLTESVTVLLRADLSITKTNTAGVNGEVDQATDTVTSGVTTTYTLVVTNNGPDTFSGAVVKDVIVSGLSCTSTDAVTITGDGVPSGSFTISDLTGAGITLGELADGEKTTISYSCDVN